MSGRQLDGVVVGWDIDGVWYDFVQAFIDFLRFERNVTGPLPYAETWHFYRDQWGWTTETFLKQYGDAVREWNLFRYHPLYAIGDPKPIFDKVKELGGSNVIVSARRIHGAQVHAMRNTLNWIEELDLPVDDVHFNEDKTSVWTDFFIEDNADNFLALERAGTSAYIFDQPWNAHIETTKRVFSHDEFLNRILEETA